MGNLSCVCVFFNGMLELLVIELGDGGIFICIVVNVVGEVIVVVELIVGFLLFF